MRIALLSDIHGNRLALEAVLADAGSLGVDAYLVLGDHVAVGPEPVAVIERLTGLENATFVRGNTDRYLVAGEVPYPGPDDLKAHPDLTEHMPRIVESYDWTRSRIAARGWSGWLAALPLEQRTMLPDGTPLLAVHAAPGTDDGQGLHPGRSNEELAELVAGCEAELVCVGHTHQPVDRRLVGTRVVNPGSVSNPIGHDLRASYAVIDASDTGYDLHHRRVPYDHQEFMESARRIGHPAAEFIAYLQLGGRKGRTPHSDHQELTMREG